MLDRFFDSYPFVLLALILWAYGDNKIFGYIVFGIIAILLVCGIGFLIYTYPLYAFCAVNLAVLIWIGCN